MWALLCPENYKHVQHTELVLSQSFGGKQVSVQLVRGVRGDKEADERAIQAWDAFPWGRGPACVSGLTAIPERTSPSHGTKPEGGRGRQRAGLHAGATAVKRSVNSGLAGYQGLDALNSRHLFSYSLGGQKSKIRVPTGVISFEDELSLPGF